MLFCTLENCCYTSSELCLCLLISTKKKSNRTEPSSTSEVPTVPETKFFAVAPYLKSVFDNTDRPFSLFGSNTGACDQSVADDNDDGIDASDAKVSGKSLRQVNICC